MFFDAFFRFLPAAAPTNAPTAAPTRNLRTQCAPPAKQGDTIYGKPNMSEAGAADVSEIPGPPGWMLKAKGPGDYSFTLYTGKDRELAVGEATVSVGDCDAEDEIDRGSYVSWSVYGGSGFCVTRDTNVNEMHADVEDLQSGTYNKYVFDCCKQGTDCYIAVDTAIASIDCGDC